MNRSLILFLLSFCLGSLSVFSQTDKNKAIEYEISLIVNDLEIVKEELSQLFIEQQNGLPQIFVETKESIYTTFLLSGKAYYEFQRAVETWGFVESKMLKTFIPSEEYIDEQQQFSIRLNIQENNLQTNHEPVDFSFVNMPGIQYSILRVENPVAGEFPNQFSGYSIKYLMNRRKTFIRLGLFKPNNKNENNQFNDLYLIGIGQDFYSSHLGRGNNKFLNLYSGFEVGVNILTGKNQKEGSMYTIPSLGLELFKNKNILIDNKLGYYLPFKENRNMRGLLYEASINILF